MTATAITTQGQDFKASFIVDQTPDEVFNAISNVPAWWSEDFGGDTEKVGDEFWVNFTTFHFSKHRITDLIPDKKVVWLVTESKLTFLEDTKEWDGTRTIFEISTENGRTKVTFTHIGLTPRLECYKDCFKGWNYYLKSLEDLITTGAGQPNLK